MLDRQFECLCKPLLFRRTFGAHAHNIRQSVECNRPADLQILDIVQIAVTSCIQEPFQIASNSRLKFLETCRTRLRRLGRYIRLKIDQPIEDRWCDSYLKVFACHRMLNSICRNEKNIAGCCCRSGHSRRNNILQTDLKETSLRPPY